jgi:hypothetical protein
MASLRTSSLLSRFTRPAATAFRQQALTSSRQWRGLASHLERTYPQTPYDRGENVGGNTFNHFNMDGKVFVVTGTASCPPQIAEQRDSLYL